jgi:hypothetical protein
LVNEEAWWRFARAIAGRNITLLRDVFDISSKVITQSMIWDEEAVRTALGHEEVQEC